MADILNKSFSNDSSKIKTKKVVWYDLYDIYDRRYYKYYTYVNNNIFTNVMVDITFSTKNKTLRQVKVFERLEFFSIPM